MLGKIVLVRTYSAGVHFGELVERAGQELQLKNARRIWSWSGANSLHEIAQHGVAKSSRVSVAVPSIIVTQAIEVIEMTTESVARFAEQGWGA